MPGRTEADIIAGLLAICRDAARGFRLAADSVGDIELKRIFLDAARRREIFAAELLPFAQGSAASGTAAGTLHRKWMSARDALSGHSEASILAETIRGESTAIDAFREAVGSMLPPKARPIVQRQLDEMRGLVEDLRLLELPCM